MIFTPFSATLGFSHMPSSELISDLSYDLKYLLFYQIFDFSSVLYFFQIFFLNSLYIVFLCFPDFKQNFMEKITNYYLVNAKFLFHLIFVDFMILSFFFLILISLMKNKYFYKIIDFLLSYDKFDIRFELTSQYMRKPLNE